MIEDLKEIESILPDLIKSDDGWNGLYITYCKPIMYRLWRQHRENRIYIHRLLPCDTSEVYPHLHSWPCVVKIMSGVQEMAAGCINETNNYIHSTNHWLKPGDTYSMTNPDAWHCIRPVSLPSISLMVGGPAFNKETLSKQHKDWFFTQKDSKDSHRELNAMEVNHLLSEFKSAWEDLTILTKIML